MSDSQHIVVSNLMQVYIWTVEEDESADENDEALSADLRSTLKEYPCQVNFVQLYHFKQYLSNKETGFDP